MNKTLIELTTETKELLDALYELEQLGETPPEELTIALNELVTNQAEKIDRVASFILYCDSQQDWLREEKKRIDMQIKKLEYMAEKTKWLAFRAMELEGVDKLEGLKGHFFSKRNSTSVEVTELSDIPGEYLTVETKVNKAELLKDLRAGKEIPGAMLKTKTSVVVK